MVRCSCAREHPKLRQRFFAWLEAKTASPLELEVLDPESGQPVVIALRGRELAGLLAPGTEPPQELLSTIVAVLDGRHDGLLPRLGGAFAASTGEGIGMRLSVWCAEETLLSSPEAITAATTEFPALAGMSPTVFELPTCQAWGVPPADEREDQPVHGEIPTLLLSGELDAVTPVEWAQQMNEHLARGSHLVFPGLGHSPAFQWPEPCAMQAAALFVDDPSGSPRPSCLDPS